MPSALAASVESCDGDTADASSSDETAAPIAADVIRTTARSSWPVEVSTDVFPTSGSANPTLTLVALSLRLSDHLRTKLG